MASTDDGSTWSAVDSAIYAAGQVVTSYTAIPGTTSLYAMSVPQQTPYDQENNAALWSSEDAGAHWTRVGPAPFAQATLTGTTHTPGGSTLYAVGTNLPPPAVCCLSSPVATAAAPGCQCPAPAGRRARRPIPGRSLPWPTARYCCSSSSRPKVTFPELGMNANVSFYAWRPGDTTWFPVTPRPGGGTVVQAWLTSPANGPQTLWIVVASQQGPTYTVRQCVLQ